MLPRAWLRCLQVLGTQGGPVTNMDSPSSLHTKNVYIRIDQNLHIFTQININLWIPTKLRLILNIFPHINNGNIRSSLAIGHHNYISNCDKTRLPFPNWIVQTIKLVSLSIAGDFSWNLFSIFFAQRLWCRLLWQKKLSILKSLAPPEFFSGLL